MTELNMKIVVVPAQAERAHICPLRAAAVPRLFQDVP
jgi:hypothetical protein